MNVSIQALLIRVARGLLLIGFSRQKIRFRTCPVGTKIPIHCFRQSVDTAAIVLSFVCNTYNTDIPVVPCTAELDGVSVHSQLREKERSSLYWMSLNSLKWMSSGGTVLKVCTALVDDVLLVLSGK